ncbi:MAG: DUF4923 family protein [Tannerella sp.]|jgi:hypothetical protein|nr:DUF4923 family protein [Tannerella sp.]
MKSSILAATIAALSMAALGCKAQSSLLKALLSKENVERAAAAVSHKNDKSNMLNLTGSWSYTGMAVGFEPGSPFSQNSAILSAVMEKEMNRAAKKDGAKPGMLVFTFKADSSFTVQQPAQPEKTVKGNYHCNLPAQTVTLQYPQETALVGKVTGSASKMKLLFDEAKLYKLMNQIAKQNGIATLQTMDSLSVHYAGIMLGFDLKKE